MILQLLLNVLALFIIPGAVITYLFHLGENIFEKLLFSLSLSIALSVITGFVLGYLGMFNALNVYISLAVILFACFIFSRFVRKMNGK